MDGPGSQGLEESARASFSVLSDAEINLIRHALRGEVAEYSPSPDPANWDDPNNNPKDAGAWVGRTLRSDVIRWMCVSAEAQRAVDPRGIRISAAVISGKLDLSFVTVPFPLRFRNCSFSDPIDLSGARLSDLSLDGSRTHAIIADSVTIAGAISLARHFHACSEVRAIGADIRGSLTCTDATFDNPTGDALVVDGATVRGDIMLDDGFRSKGTVRLLGASIGGGLYCSNAAFENDTGWALSLDGATVHGDIFFDAGMSAAGEVRLLGASVGGQLLCSGGVFNNPDGDALSADGATVRGDVFFDAGFRASGTVRVPGADIRGSLYCSGGAFERPKGGALGAQRAKVGGSVFLDEGFRAQGAVRLSGASIGANLECSGGTFAHSTENPDALRADGVTVGGDVLLDNRFCATGVVGLTGAEVGGNLTLDTANLVHARITANRTIVRGRFSFCNVTTRGATPEQCANVELVGASAGILADTASSWPCAGHLDLDGFVYEHIVGSTDARDRQEWLRLTLTRSGGDRRFRPQPYEQLAKVLREQGNEAEAREILIGMEHDRQYSTPSAWRRAGLHLLGATVGYGYLPWRAVSWLTGLVVLGFVVFGWAFQAGIIVPSDKDAYADFERLGRTIPNYQSFCAAIYSLDTSLPLIDLGQKGRWTPSLDAASVSPARSDGLVFDRFCDATFLKIQIPRDWRRIAGRVVQAYLWVHLLLGWFFATMFVAGVTGLVRSR